MKTIDEMIAVMTAFKNGERIEFSNAGKGSWYKNPTPEWDWKNFGYRVAEVKTEPKVIEPKLYWNNITGEVYMSTAHASLNKHTFELKRISGFGDLRFEVLK